MYNYIKDPLNGKSIKINTNLGKSIVKKYIKNILLVNKKGGGPLVKITDSMLKNISIPSAEINKTGNDCSAIALYFLGIFGSTMIKILQLIKKRPFSGINDNIILQLIREYENNIRKNYKDNIIEDNGPSKYFSFVHPVNMKSRKSKIKWYKRAVTKIFENIPNGYGTICSYGRFDYSGHIVLVIRGNNGSFNILDLQTGSLIRSYNKTEIALFFYQENIYEFAIYYDGLKLNSVLKSNTGIPGHKRNQWDKKTIELARIIST